MSRAQPYFVETAANMESRQRRSKVWLYFTRKDDHRATCNACKMSILSKGGNTTILQKHLSIHHAITVQECHVFERYGVTITLISSVCTLGARGALPHQIQMPLLCRKL